MAWHPQHTRLFAVDTRRFEGPPRFWLALSLDTTRAVDISGVSQPFNIGKLARRARSSGRSAKPRQNPQSNNIWRGRSLRQTVEALPKAL